MKVYSIKKEAFLNVLSSLSAEYDFFVPGQKEFEGFDKKNLQLTQPLFSAKQMLFPPTQRLFSFTKEREEVHLSWSMDEGRVKVAIVPSCDAKAFTVLDNVFGWDYKDDLYLRERERSIIIAFGCNLAEPTCFCRSFDTSPTADAFLIERGQDYLLSILSKKGERLFERREDFMEEREDVFLREQEGLYEGVESIKIERVHECLEGSFTLPIWEQVWCGCIGCGACTMVCPTCHCFDIVDEEEGGGKGARFRVWDSCSFALFTKMPAHQPRTAQFQRFRQRILHKFLYFPKRFSTFACTGCGRCIKVCPASLDIREVLQRFLQ